MLKVETGIEANNLKTEVNVDIKAIQQAKEPTSSKLKDKNRKLKLKRKPEDPKMAVTPANPQKSPPNGGSGLSEDPGNDLVSPDSIMGLKPLDPPAALHSVPELSEDETMGLVPRASRLVKTLINLKGETVESKPATPAGRKYGANIPSCGTI